MALKPMSVDAEFKKNPNLNLDDLEHLREWNKKQPHLPIIGELDLILFLHSNYYKIEPSKATIEAYYTCRSHVPEFFNQRDPQNKNIIDAQKVIVFAPLEEDTEEGQRAILCKIRITDPARFDLADNIKTFCMVADLIEHERGTAKGHVIILDCNGVKLGHIARLGIMQIKKGMYFLQEAMPVRLKGVHFINVVPFLDKILNLVKPFVKAELMDILHFHQGVETLYPYIPQKYLPKEIAGGSVSWETLHENCWTKVNANRDYFLEEERTMRVNEKLRPGKPKNGGDIFGVEGSFKRLMID